MTRTLLRTVAAAAFLLVVAGCSSAGSSANRLSQNMPAGPEQSGQSSQSGGAATAAGDSTQLHNHGAGVSKLGLSPGVVDNIMEGTDIAQLSADGKSLVEVDLFNTLDLLHGSLLIVKDQVMINLNGKSVVWSDRATDLPADANLVAPVTWNGNRLRMSRDLLEQLMQLSGMKGGRLEVKDGKLYITTGR